MPQFIVIDSHIPVDHIIGKFFSRYIIIDEIQYHVRIEQPDTMTSSCVNPSMRLKPGSRWEGGSQVKLLFTGEKKMKTGRKPLYQPNQLVKIKNSPVKILISPVVMKNRPVDLSFLPVKKVNWC
jgi:hypothetical protein